MDATSQGSFSHLTRHRVPGAMPIGAKYRLIDFTLSNCKNSKIYNVAIFPYGNYRSLSDQIGSGDRWDLNRRRDGIFILPPKLMNATIDHEISFQRMHEHIEYFTRSTQEYALITPANVVINIDYSSLLDRHIENDLDLSSFVAEDYKRLRIYIIKKDLLLDYIDRYEQIQYRNLSDVFDFSTSLKKASHRIYQSSFLVESSRDLFNANMQLLYPNVSKEIFQKSRPIYSKETMSAPTRYGQDAKVKNSIIASGAFIEGEVFNSVIGRKAHIKKGAKVYHSVLMNHSVIGENAYVEYSVLDKETNVLPDSQVIGTVDQLFVSEKRQTVTSEKDLSILQVSAEVTPFMKTGGLADMVGANAEIYPSLGKKSMVVMPLYPQIQKNYELLLTDVTEKNIDFNGQSYKATLSRLNHHSTVYYFIETYQFFEREKIYGYEDDDERFAFFNLAVVEFLEDFESYPDLIHVHDWHSALIPLIAIEKKKDIQTLLTIHNIEYQGEFSNRILSALNIKNEYGFIGPSSINFLEIGIHLADKVSTVSETYKDELSYQYYSKNLVESIQRRSRDFYGILNGISDDIGPKDDLEIAQKYDLVNVFSAKKTNKLDLQKRMGIQVDSKAFVIGMVTRIVELKGFDIILPALYNVLENPQIQFVILGTGNEKYLQMLRDLKERFPNQVSVNLTYDATNPNYIYAGVDLFLMPSRIEPCGLGQMIALRYGSIPLVRQTGGLNDTVDHYDMSSKRGTGFKFYNFDVRDLIFQIHYAYDIYLNHPNDWRQLIINAMNARFTIKDSAIKYSALYEMMV